MQLQILTSDQEFLELREPWNSLGSDPLRSFDWQYGWWKNLAGNSDLRVYTWQLESQVVGIAPFCVDGWMGQKRLRLLGSGKACTDYGHIIVAPEYADDFSAAIAAEIAQSDQIKMVEFDGIREIGNLDNLCHRLVRTHWRYDKQLEPAWSLRLPDSWDQFVSNAGKSLRRKIRKARKRLDSGQATVHSTRDGLDFDQAFAELVRLHQLRFISKGERGVFSDPGFTRFLNDAVRALGSRGEAELLIGEIDDVSIAAQLFLLSDSGPQFYQSGYAPDSMAYEPGHLLFTFAVQRAIENGSELFDFLRGDESYKSYWGAEPQPLWKIRYVSKQLAPTAVNQAYRALRSVKINCATFLSNLSPSP